MVAFQPLDVLFRPVFQKAILILHVTGFLNVIFWSVQKHCPRFCSDKNKAKKSSLNITTRQSKQQIKCLFRSTG